MVRRCAKCLGHHQDLRSGAEPRREARDYIRLFLMPGVLHCGGGPGPSTVDWPAVLSDWVERGKAPDSIVARKLAGDGTVSRSRPLCVYPQRAQSRGSGSPDDAASFVCK